MENAQKLETTTLKFNLPSSQSSESECAKDQLTGLDTLDAFSHQLDRLINSRAFTQTSMTLMLLQLANFYEIRNWIGKSEANFLLNDLARLLEKTVPANSIICLCHNHEFAVLLVNEGSRTCSRVGDSIRLALQSCDLQSIPPQLHLQCGIGITAVNEYTPSSEVAFARARHYLSVNQGEQPIGQSIENIQSQKSGDLLNLVASAISLNLYKLCFQATICFSEDTIEHYELRTSLKNEETALPASIFLETINQNALGVSFDCWVIEQAIDLLKADSYGQLHLTINLTQNSLVSRSFLQWLKTVLSRNLTICRKMVFQISEIDILIAQHHLETFSRDINALGIRLCISHFGSTSDPIRYLPLLETHAIKLDHSLIRLATVERKKYQNLTELVRTIHDRGIKVIAPMVEQIQDLPLLWEAGVDFVQGYSLHKPDSQPNFEFVKNLELIVT